MTECMMGMICWNEDFVDEDTNEVITIERHEVVKINGEWVI